MCVCESKQGRLSETKMDVSRDGCASVGWTRRAWSIVDSARAVQFCCCPQTRVMSGCVLTNSRIRQANREEKARSVSQYLPIYGLSRSIGGEELLTDICFWLELVVLLLPESWFPLCGLSMPSYQGIMSIFTKSIPKRLPQHLNLCPRSKLFSAVWILTKIS